MRVGARHPDGCRSRGGLRTAAVSAPPRGTKRMWRARMASVTTAIGGSMRSLAILLLVPAGCGGFARSCYDMYAPDMLLLEIRGAPPDGVWQIIIEGDGEVRECGGQTSSGSWFALNCDADLTMSGTDLIWWESAPRDVVVSFLLGNEPYLEERFSPEYEVEEPNGRGCGSRERATELVELF